MDTSAPLVEAVPSEAPLPLLERAAAVFVRPARAWAGLRERGEWWFPLLLVLIVSMAGNALIYERAVVPMMHAQFQRQVESGQIPPQRVDRIEASMASPGGLAVNVASVAVVVPLLVLAMALLPWLAAGFMLGHRFTYRDAFVVTAWAELVRLPAVVLTYALAWVQQDLASVHIGFGALLPVAESPSRLLVGLGRFLDDGIGPLSIWYLAVLVLGTASLSGAPRRAVAWAVGGLWVVVMLFIAALAAFMSPGA